MTHDALKAKRRTAVIVKWEGGKDGNPVLFLPEYTATAGRIVCYAHLGQHSEASTEYYRSRRNCLMPSQKATAKELLREYAATLESGEALRIVRRDTPLFKKQRWGRY